MLIFHRVSSDLLSKQFNNFRNRTIVKIIFIFFNHPQENLELIIDCSRILNIINPIGKILFLNKLK